MKNISDTSTPGTWRFDPPAPMTIPDESPEALFSRATGLHQSGQFELAELLYRQLLDIQPAHGDALHLLGVLRYQQRDPAAAVPLIEAALKIIPTNPVAWIGLGLALMKLSRFDEALTHIDRGLEIKPDHAEGLSKRGDALQALGKKKEAVAAYNRSLRYRPDHAETLNSRAVALIALGRAGEALTSLDQALRIAPAHVEAMNNRATALTLLKRFAEALATCDKALSIQPDISQLHDNRGAALRNLGRRDEAITAFQAALACAQDTADIHANLGRTLMETGQLEPAEQHLRQALAAKPDTVSYQSLVNVLYRLGKTSDLRKLYRDWLAFEPDNPVARHMVTAGLDTVPEGISWGDIEASQPDSQDHASLLAGYERALAENPDNADTWYNHGLTLHRLGRTEAALGSYARTLALQPGHPEALNHRGMALCKLGDLQEGLDSFRRALALRPDNAGYQLNIGKALLGLGQAADAELSLRQALTSGPSAALFATLASALYRLGRHDEAIDIYQQWTSFEPDNPMPRHMISAGSHAVPERASDEYVAMLFDSFAETFESTLAGLGYQTPALVTAMIKAELGSDGAPLRILDAGCGTGLAAPLLKPLASRLVGVDLSEKMLDKARERLLYDELVRGELCAFMASRPAAFDLIILADTLVYFGALEEAFRTAHHALAPGGILAFALESHADSDPDYRLEPHGRYSHHPDYVRRLLTARGYTVQALEPAVLRRELDADVAGITIVARRNHP